MGGKSFSEKKGVSGALLEVGGRGIEIVRKVRVRRKWRKLEKVGGCPRINKKSNFFFQNPLKMEIFGINGKFFQLANNNNK